MVDSDGNISGLGEGACTVTVTDAANCTETATFQIVEPDELSIDNVIIVDDTDGDSKGSISLEVSGGTGDLDYNWSEAGLPNSPLAENLFGGTYSVTITDENDCELIATYEVEGIRIVGTVVGVSCFGEVDGGVDIVITGGSGNYDISWTCNGQIDPDGSINGLPAGEVCTITVMDMDTDLSAEATFTITGPDAALNGEFKFNDCDEDISMAEVIIAGGTEPYDITWNTIPPQSGPTANDLEPGQDLIVIVRDANDCELMLTGRNTVCQDGDECFKSIEAITPNRDGKNDYLIIDCVFDYNNRLTIYNRWGQEVYQVDNYQNDWEGTESGGSNVEDGTYYWVLEVFVTGVDTRVYKGHVTVYREFN